MKNQQTEAKVIVWHWNRCYVANARLAKNQERFSEFYRGRMYDMTNEGEKLNIGSDDWNEFEEAGIFATNFNYHRIFKFNEKVYEIHRKNEKENEKRRSEIKHIPMPGGLVSELEDDEVGA